MPIKYFNILKKKNQPRCGLEVSLSFCRDKERNHFAWFLGCCFAIHRNCRHFLSYAMKLIEAFNVVFRDGRNRQRKEEGNES